MSRFDRKHSDRFGEYLDDTDTAPRHHRRTAADDAVVPLLPLVRALRELPPPSAPETEFRSSLRSFLVATAERGVGVAASDDTTAWLAIRDGRSSAKALLGRTQPVRQVTTRGSGRTRVAVLVGVAAGAIVLSGVSGASTGALPGDPLYTVKRSTERAQLALAGSDAGRGTLYLEFAQSRLEEARQVDPDRVGKVLPDMDDETRNGVRLLDAAAVANDDPTALSVVSSFLERQVPALLALRNTLPAAAGSRATEPSLDLLDSIRERIRELNNALAYNCPIVNADTLGPKPPAGC